jgi:Transposase DDE domain
MNPFQPYIAEIAALPARLNYKKAFNEDAVVGENGIKTTNINLSEVITPYKLDQLGTLAYAMLQNSTVCLYQCRGTVAQERDIELPSAHQYLIRFFKTGKAEELGWLCFAMIFKMLKKVEKAYFLIDRTEWKHGGRWYNLLVIGLVVNQIFIPLVCHDLGERKSSSTEERKQLWSEFEAKIRWINDGVLPTIYVAADREFGSAAWVDFLAGQHVYFVLRAKGNHKWDFLADYTTTSNKPARLATLARWGRRKGITTFILFSKATNAIVYLHIVHLERAPKGQQNFLCLLSNLSQAPAVEEFYACRWKIESCFKHLKTNGFNLEKLNLLPIQSVELIFMVLSLVYTLTIMEGIAHDFDKTVRIIKYKDGSSYPAVSLFAFAKQIMKKTVTSLDTFHQRICFFWDTKIILDFELTKN